MVTVHDFDQLINQAKDNLQSFGPSEKLKTEFLGRKGKLNRLLEQIPSLPTMKRKTVGEKANQTKLLLTKLLTPSVKSETTEMDLTLPLSLPAHGHEHPIANMIDRLYQIFGQLGFTVFETPEVETERDNFDFLRVAQDHPARDMQDTFWTTTGLVLRTQTTAFQRRVLEQLQPPFAVMQAGKVFRAESEDATHLSTLHMLDGFAVGENLSLAHLRGCLFTAMEQLFGLEAKFRFRPSFFPFVEPGAELDIQCKHCFGRGCRACGHQGYLELLGCGMTHPEIIKAAGLNAEKYHGIAWGMGIERLAMQYWGVNDIREFVKNDPRFLEQLV